jgi:tRNA-2-methylthio-N6-dimethylallyladenosine synthase
MKPTISPDEADMILLNTCHIREKAAEKVYSELGRYWAAQGRRKPDGLKIGPLQAVSRRPKATRSCAVQPTVDVVVGPAELSPPAGVGGEAETGAARSCDTDFPEEDKFEHAQTPPEGQTRPDGVSDRAGGLRQVLRVLRGAVYARHGNLASSGRRL